MLELTTLQKIVLWLIPTIFAITLHEVAHGYVASKLGDPTAKFLGRLTLNPLKHIDPLGTLVVPIVLYLIGGFIFGWAKPVPIDWRNLRKPKRDMALVALAGPMANLLMAIAWAIIINIIGSILRDSNSAWQALLMYMGFIGVSINIILMVLNLLPVPPLDGSRVITAFLSAQAGQAYNKIEPYGFLILLLLLATGVLSEVIMPLAAGAQSLLVNFINLF